MERRSLLAAWILAAALAAGCVVPMPKGQEVLVDRRVRGTWSGKAVLLEISEDRSHCLVAVRASSLRVERRWVPCRYVHGEGDLGI